MNQLTEKILSDMYQFFLTFLRVTTAVFVYGFLAIVFYKEFHSAPSNTFSKWMHERQTTPSQVSSITLKAVVFATATPNEYAVHLKWTSTGKQKTWTIRRSDGTANQTRLTTLDGSENEYWDTDVMAGKSYRYILSGVGVYGHTEKKQLKVVIPRDLVIEKATRVDRIGAVNRLYLKPGAHLRAADKGGLIRAKEIIAADPAIGILPVEKPLETTETNEVGGGDQQGWSQRLQSDPSQKDNGASK